jgi:hypothetical protein
MSSKSESKLKLLYDWQSVRQYVLVSSTLVGLATRYYFLSEICGLVSVWSPLWREDGSAICSAISQWPESLRTRNHILQTPPTWRSEVTLRLTASQTVLASSPPWDLRPDINSVWILLFWLCWGGGVRFPYLYPPGIGWPSYTRGHWVDRIRSVLTPDPGKWKCVGNVGTGFQKPPPLCTH